MKEFKKLMLASAITLSATMFIGCGPDTKINSSAKTDKSYGDIADPVVWVSADGSTQRLIASLEDDGIAVFDKDGKQLVQDNSRVVLGTDIRYDIKSTDGKSIDLLTVSLPEEEAIGFYVVKDDASAPLEFLGSLSVGMEAEAVCLYKNVTTSELTVTAVGDSGEAIQYKLNYNGTGIESAVKDKYGNPVMVRKFNVGGELSACVVDDETAILYVAEQGLGVWAYGADAENIKERRLVDSIGPLGNLGEIEGMDIVYEKDGKGYLLIGDESEGFLLYEREGNNKFVKKFTVDGIDEAKAVSVGMDGFWVGNSEADEPVYEKLSYSDVNTLLPAEGALDNVVSLRNLSLEGVSLVKSKLETTEVDDDGDAADDPAFWLHPTDASKSMIIGTNKQGGLMAYNMDGEELQYLNEGEPNNVDIRNVKAADGSTISLAAATNRDGNTITLYQIQEATDSVKPITKLTATGSNTKDGELASELKEVYGLCMYQSTDGTPYVFANGKDGTVEQWKITLGDSITGEKVRMLKVESQPEGCVADDKTGILYLGEEDVGIWTFEAAENGATTATEFAKIDGKTLVADVEGLTMYDNGTNKYLLASSQGNNTFVVYDLNNNNKVVSTFAIIGDDAKGLDGVSDTDGIHAVSTPVGSNYPNGLFIAQDFYNINAEYGLENQNFKVVNWDDIASTFK